MNLRPEDIEIRLCVPEDGWEIVELLYTHKEYLSSLNYSEDIGLKELHTIVSALLEPGQAPRMIVGKHNEQSVGFAWTMTGITGQWAQANFMVSPQFKGAGRVFGISAARFAFDEMGFERLMANWTVDLDESSIRRFLRAPDGNPLSYNTHLKIGFKFSGIVSLILTPEDVKVLEEEAAA